MISANKIFCHLADGKRPVTADIFITDFCNNNCPYCNYVRYVDRNNNYMRCEDFKRYARRLLDLGVQGIILTGGGEPTINPEFGKITRFMEESGIPYGINTNFNVYKDCNPVFLKVSLDGYSEESYIARRGVKAYGKVLQNVRTFRQWHSGTRLGLQMLATDCKSVRKFYLANKNMDVDYFVFRPVESRGAEYYQNEENRKEAERIMEEVLLLAKSDSRVMLNYKFNHLGDCVEECTAHWSQIAVNTDGYVMYCCHKPNEIVGHIMDEDIWEKHCSAEYNRCSCDIPCRLSGPNAALQGLKLITEPMFI